MLKKLTTKVLPVLLFATLIPSAVFASSNEVSSKDAVKAALFQVVLDQKENNYSKWKDLIVSASEPVLVYDISGEKHSYIVNLKASGREVGFVEVSYYKDDNPILSFGYSSNRMADQEKSELRNKVKQMGKQVATEKVIINGPAKFALKKEFSDGSAEIIESKEVAELTKEQNQRIKKKERKENKEGKKFWKNIDDVTSEIGTTSDGVTDNPGAYESGYSSTNSKFWDGVGDANQYTNSLWTGASGCAPTSGYNLMFYWHYQKGFSGLLKNSSGYVDKDDSVLLMRQKMGTDNAGNTSVSAKASGLRAYAVARGYKSSSSTLTTSPSWNTVKSHMSSAPSLLDFFDQSFYCGSSSCGHTVVGVGYTEYFYNGSSSGHQYMIVHDNWGNTPENVYVAYGRNYTSMNSLLYSM
ncbi:hypothetical protein YDYSY3_31850 [Paenibacillus chitinolyticus]|uniref:hypothetical protein n=1 Tax=Paenibacillus chitinolyticus TaxID=79263 RepID=UPI0026E4ADD8|nr:hypothetical protein [Paenibacillus chitinolyticus]GKS12185.1 hypothetical protein YDYSY3_31850 [Paenibacillus chitinolyticus]